MYIPYGRHTAWIITLNQQTHIQPSQFQQLLSLPLDMAEAMILNGAMKGIGTKERLIWPVLCGRSNEEIAKLKATYFAMYSKDLSIQLAGELSGNFERMIFWCLQGLEKEYDEDYFTADKAKEDAEAFHKAGAGKFGTDEHSLFKIICESPKEHLQKINAVYTDKYEITLLGSLKKELSGDVGQACLYAVGMKLKPYITAAKHIAKTCEGFGTGKRHSYYFYVFPLIWLSIVILPTTLTCDVKMKIMAIR